MTDIPINDAKKLGLSLSSLNKLDDLAGEYIQSQRLPGLVALVARRGEVGFCRAWGQQDHLLGKEMATDSIFRIASMSKLVTSVAAMMLMEQGAFGLDDPIRFYAPELVDLKVLRADSTREDLRYEKQTEEIRFHHLLNHTAGFAYDFTANYPLRPLYESAHMFAPELTLEQMVERLWKLPLNFQPGQGHRYGASTDVLGYMIAKLSGKSFRDYLRENVFQPLEMGDTDFIVSADHVSRFAALYKLDEQRKFIQVQSAAESPLVNKKRLHSGGGGLASTVIDYYRFCQMLLNGGEWQGRRLLKRETVTWMLNNRLDEHFLPLNINFGPYYDFTGYGQGYGVKVLQQAQATNPSLPGEYGWVGGFGTYFFVDPQQELIAILYSHLFPFSVYPLEKAFKKIVYDALA